jgi:hypothetical protein
MLQFFSASPDRVRWELVQVTGDGPYRLAIYHAKGVVIESFNTLTMALKRVQDLEELLSAARQEPAPLAS